MSDYLFSIEGIFHEGPRDTTSFLGISMQPHSSGLFLSQATYAKDIIERASMLNYKPCTTSHILRPKSQLATMLTILVVLISGFIQFLICV